MDPEIKRKPPGSSSFRAAEVNTNTNKTHLAENSEERNPKRWSAAIPKDRLVRAFFCPSQGHL